MPELADEFTLDVPPETAWEHLTDMEFFASHLPGFVDYEEISDDVSHWTVGIDVSRFSQRITFEVTVLEEEFPDAAIQLDPIDQAADGDGTVHFESDGDGGTVVAFEFTANAKGPMAPVTNAVIGRALPKMYDNFRENLEESDRLTGE